MRFRKRKIIYVFTAVLLLFSLTACSFAGKSVRLGTGNAGGSYYAYGNALAELTRDTVKLDVSTTAGSAANLRLLQKGFLDAAIVQSNILYMAKEGTGVFANGSLDGNINFSAVAGLYTECLQIVVRADSDINTIEDLKGHKVSVGEAESGVIWDAEQLLALYGLTFGSIKAFKYSYDESAHALQNGKIDAFFCMAGAPTKAIKDLAADGKIRILSLSDEDIRKIQNRFPIYSKTIIPSGTYDGVEDVQTIGVHAVLVVSNKVKRETVKKLTQSLFTYTGELNENIATDDAIDAAFATKNIPIAFHPGAKEYYESIGVSVQENTNTDLDFVFGGQDG